MINLITKALTENKKIELTFIDGTTLDNISGLAKSSVIGDDTIVCLAQGHNELVINLSLVKFVRIF